MLTHVLGKAVERTEVSLSSRKSSFAAVGELVDSRRVGVTYFAALLTMTLSAMMGVLW